MAPLDFGLFIYHLNFTNALFASKDFVSAFDKSHFNYMIPSPLRYDLRTTRNNKERGIFLRRKDATSFGNARLSIEANGCAAFSLENYDRLATVGRWN